MPKKSRTESRFPSLSLRPPTRVVIPSRFGLVRTEQVRLLVQLKYIYLRLPTSDIATSFHFLPRARVSDSVQTLSIYCCTLIPVLARKGKISGWKSATDPISTLETKYTHQSSGNEVKPVRRIIRKTNSGSRIQGDARTTAEG